jgi:hypothetical protein
MPLRAFLPSRQTVTQLKKEQTMPVEPGSDEMLTPLGGIKLPRSARTVVMNIEGLLTIADPGDAIINDFHLAGEHQGESFIYTPAGLR